MRKFLTQIFTEPDNKTACPVRIAALAGLFQYFGLTTANYVQHGVFGPKDFAVGLGALLAGTGAALGFKKDSPKEQ